MGHMTVDGLEKQELASAKREQKLAKLTSTPFDIKNEKQLAKLKKHLVEFEAYTHHMYLTEAVSYGIHGWFAYRGFNFLFPIMPQTFTDLMTVGLWFGAAGFSYNKFNETDFRLQLKEMKSLYNWVMKGGNDTWSAEFDNSNKMSHPLIQRMIESMAPLCKKDFMIAWPRLTDESENKQGGLFNTISSYASYGFSLFSATPKEDLTQTAKVAEMKLKVENRGYDMSVFAKFKRAMEYYIVDKDYHEHLKAKAPGVLSSMKESALEYVPESFSGKAKLM